METTLRDCPWAFAQASVALAPVAQTVPGWEFAYAYPENCLFLHGLSDADCDPGRRPVWRYPYRILAATSGESRVIATDLSDAWRSEEHTSELQSLMRNSYAVFCLKQKKRQKL